MPLMIYKEYANIRHAIPYKLIIKSGVNFLYYFGERHSFNPSDKQWQEVKDFWDDFLKQTIGQKRIVFIEGGIRPFEDNESQSIIKHGGMGLATYLGHKAGIETYSPEPDEKLEYNELLKEFTHEEVQYYYFARMVYQWGLKEEPKPNFEEYMNEFSIEAMKKVHGDLFSTTFDENDTEFFYGIINPVEPKTIINKVSAKSSEIRDRYIVNEIKKYIADGYSIFAHYGCSHVVMQEPLLREVL